MLQSSLILVAALVYFINSLHSRPDDGSYARRLCKAIFPLADDPDSPDLIVQSRNDDEGEGRPYAIGGVMYLRNILLKPTGTTYRFSEVRIIEDDVFQHAIGCLPEDVADYLFKSRLHRQARMAGYVPQRKGPTKRRSAREEEETEPLQPLFPELAGVIEQVVVETEEGFQAPPKEINLAEVLDRILQQFASDIMQKCGNPREGPLLGRSYCPLVQYDRQHLNFDDINTLDLGHLFLQVQWQRATRDDWKQAVKRLFPPATHIDSFSTVHFTSCRYYRTYQDLLMVLPKERVVEVRSMLKKKIAELAWIPATLSGRLWDYTEGDSTWKKVPFPNLRGPRILVNYRSGGQVTIVNNLVEDAEFLEQLEDAANNRRRIALREEEEESEEDVPVFHARRRIDHQEETPAVVARRSQTRSVQREPSALLVRRSQTRSV